ncbi:AI-2E family transporter [Paracoccaceae bacterium Fryx2]|nr:AI-2E family transporter [Paracoccaceae bacterium Fryx2]
MAKPLSTPLKSENPSRAVLGGEPEVQTRGITLTTLIVIVAVATILHLGQEVFLPLSMAVLLAFALSPVVSFLRNRGLPHIASVLAAVLMAFFAIGLFMLLSALQIGVLVQDLPSFQANIVQKLNALKDSGDGTGLVARLSAMFEAINAEISNAVPDVNPLASPAVDNSPLAVEVIERQSVVDVLSSLVVPLIRPVATAGLVIVVVIFMLLEREEIRDRFIRLLGARDLHRTTQVLEEAGGRVGTYLLVQLLVNTIYAIPIGLGLWMIGVPNALLWGLLTLVLRFVPFIGSFLAATFPLFLAFAASPGWSAVLWTIALFLVVELITSNIIEPWLYGSRTGVSPLAIIVCAIFWTYIWGPLGLVLSTPLTVCLVVLGRHVPQFEVFDILFGDEPVLAPHSRLYQRLLAGDPIEATFRAEEALEELYLAEYYRDVGIPALLLGQIDFERGLLTSVQEDRLALSARQLVSELAVFVTEELNEAAKGTAAAAADAATADLDATETGSEAAADGGSARVPALQNTGLEGVGFKVLSIGGRSKLDDVAAAMLAQSIAAEGAEASELSYMDLTASRFGAISATDASCIILNFLDQSPSRGSLLHVRRIKRAVPHLRVGVMIWQMPQALVDADITLRSGLGLASKDKIAEAEGLGSDFVVTNLPDALAAAFQDIAPKPVDEFPRMNPQRKSKLRLAEKQKPAAIGLERNA